MGHVIHCHREDGVGAERAYIAHGNLPCFDVTELENFRVYTLKVSAFTRIGVGIVSSTASAKTLPAGKLEIVAKNRYNIKCRQECKQKERPMQRSTGPEERLVV